MSRRRRRAALGADKTSPIQLTAITRFETYTGHLRIDLGKVSPERRHRGLRSGRIGAVAGVLRRLLDRQALQPEDLFRSGTEPIFWTVPAPGATKSAGSFRTSSLPGRNRVIEDCWN